MNKPILKQDSQVYGFLFLAFIFLIMGLAIQNIIIIMAGMSMLLFMIYRELFETGWENAPRIISDKEYLKIRKKQIKDVNL